LGLVALQQQKFGEAAQHFELANDDSGRALLALAQGRIEAAQTIAERTNDLSLLGACHLARRQLPEAEAAFAAADDWNGLGDVYSRGREFAKARDAFARAQQPAKVIQSFRNDWTLGETERLKEAISYGEQAIAGGHMVPECLCEMADIFYELGDHTQALVALDKAAAYPGFASEAALRRGRIFFYLRDYEKARAAFASVKASEVRDLALQAARESLATLDQYRTVKVESARSF
jgi:tetratricopeptide (TPR) repeat protein